MCVCTNLEVLFGGQTIDLFAFVELVLWLMMFMLHIFIIIQYLSIHLDVNNTFKSKIEKS